MQSQTSRTELAGKQQTKTFLSSGKATTLIQFKMQKNKKKKQELHRKANFFNSVKTQTGTKIITQEEKKQPFIQFGAQGKTIFNVQLFTNGRKPKPIVR